jgi:hypothetical protein
MVKRKASRKGPVYKNLVPGYRSRDLTMPLIDDLCKTVERGNFRYVACQRCGVNYSRLKKWLEKARKERRRHDDDGGMCKGEKPSLHLHLLERLEQAEGEIHAACIEDILDSKDPKLKLEFLKLRFNKLYSNNPNVRIDDETATEVKVDAKTLLLERLVAILGPSDG